MHGHSVYTLPSGEKYYGKFKEKRKHGRGVQTWPNGEKVGGNGRMAKSSREGPLFTSYIVYV